MQTEQETKQPEKQKKILKDYGEISLALHKKHGGKISLESKVPLETREDLAIAYTPGVGAVSSAIAKDPSLAKTHTLKGNTVAIVSDGSAVLGLGNIGPEAALPVMEGKAILFKKFAGLDAFPICLSTQDTEEIIRTVAAIAPSFGGINLEDIAAPRCFEIERRLREILPIPIMHDDQHGTAVVVLAGLINALAVRGISEKEAKVVVVGAGAAGIAVTEILLAYGFENIIVSDSGGIIYHGREGLALSPEKDALSIKTNLACVIDMNDPRCAVGNLAENLSGADVFIGVSRAGILTGEMIRTMNERPIIFALANPVPEIMPDEAKAAGAYIVATGRSDFPNQVNNVLAFPGIFRGAFDHSIRQFSDEMFLRAAKALAQCVESPTADHILPDPFDPKILPAVSAAMAE